MFVIFNEGDRKDLVMACFYDNEEKQKEMMHRLDEDKQVKEWQKTNSGNPPRFASRIKIVRFTNELPRFLTEPNNRKL